MRTHSSLCALVLMAVLVSTVDAGTKRTPPQEPQANITPILKELPRYQGKMGRRWRNIVISPDYPIDTLVALAKHLHREDPEASFHIFTDGNAQRFREFMLWDIHFATPKGAQHRYPERWANEHHIAHILDFTLHGWKLEIFQGRGVKPPVQWGTTIDLD